MISLEISLQQLCLGQAERIKAGDKDSREAIRMKQGRSDEDWNEDSVRGSQEEAANVIGSEIKRPREE